MNRTLHKIKTGNTETLVDSILSDTLVVAKELATYAFEPNEETRLTWAVNVVDRTPEINWYDSIVTSNAQNGVPVFGLCMYGVPKQTTI